MTTRDNVLMKSMEEISINYQKEREMNNEKESPSHKINPPVKLMK